MAKLTLPRHLLELLPEDYRLKAKSDRSVIVDGCSWFELVHDVREHFPLFAGHVLRDAGELETGFVLVVNGEIAREYTKLDFQVGDEITILASMAGG